MAKTYSQNQATKAFKVSAKTLREHIKKGKVSVIKDGSKPVRLDHSELARVYDLRDSPALLPMAVPNVANGENLGNLKALEVEVKLLREQLEDTKKEREDWKAQAQKLALPKPENTSPAKRWWHIGGKA